MLGRDFSADQLGSSFRRVQHDVRASVVGGPALRIIDASDFSAPAIKLCVIAQSAARS